MSLIAAAFLAPVWLPIKLATGKQYMAWDRARTLKMQAAQEKAGHRKASALLMGTTFAVLMFGMMYGLPALLGLPHRHSFIGLALESGIGGGFFGVTMGFVLSRRPAPRR